MSSPLQYPIKGLIYRAFWFFVVSLTLAVFFHNCSKKKFQPILDANRRSSTSLITDVAEVCGADTDCSQEEALANEALQDIDFRFSESSCLDSKQNQACLFLKNPVAAYGQAFPSLVHNRMNLTHLQNLLVTLDPATYEESTGCLKNSNYAVYKNVTLSINSTSGKTYSGEISCFPDQNFMVPYDGRDTRFQMAQLSSYFYLNTQARFMKDWTGYWFAANRGLPIISYINNPLINNNPYFEGTAIGGTNKVGTIVLPALTSGLSNTGAVQETALSGEAFLHEAGHANIFFASAPSHSAQSNLTCRQSASAPANLCCSNELGCSRAIEEGLADYHSIMIFPNSPIIGETLSNNINGFKTLGINRNYLQLQNFTMSEAYHLLSAYNLPGEIHVMGLLWGSFWFESRSEAKKLYGNRGVRALDTLFMRHLLLINGNSNFRTVCLDTIHEAQFVHGGLVHDIVTTECQRRGFIQ